MKKICKIILSYLLLTFNSYVFADDNKNNLKIGILTPLTGDLKAVGETVLYSINLALHDLGNDKIKLFPRNYGGKEKISEICQDFRNEKIKIVIGPIESKFSKELEKCDDLIFLFLSNMGTNTASNIIMMGINLESQLLAIKKFIEKEERKKTVILYPDNGYAKHVEKKLKLINFQNSKIFKYSSDPKILTSQIEKLTNYKRRKINLESRIKKLEKSEDPKDLKELNLLKQKHTLGKINFDSVVIIDFDNGLKSILTSLAYTDVSEEKILIVSVNQWFDSGILSESSIKKFYFPSINFKNYRKFKENFLKIYEYEPNEIGILAYDSLGLIYYLWKNNNKIDSIENFNLKNEIKGKIGNFKINDNKIIQNLKIYKLEDGIFIQSKS